MMEPKQHTIAKSIFLHLFPGIIIMLSIFIFSRPFIGNIFNMQKDQLPLFSFIVTCIFIATPILLGYLLYQGYKENKKISFYRILYYCNKSPVWQYLIIIPILLIWGGVFMVFLAPIINNYFIDNIFSWWPKDLIFQNILQVSKSGVCIIKMVIFLV